MTVTRTVADAVRAADNQHPFSEPLLTASDRISRQLGLPRHTVLAVLRGYHLTIQERTT